MSSFPVMTAPVAIAQKIQNMDDLRSFMQVALAAMFYRALPINLKRHCRQHYRKRDGAGVRHCDNSWLWRR